MKSLGQLVAGVAHELNNPIGFVHALFAVGVDVMKRVNDPSDGDAVSGVHRYASVSVLRGAVLRVADVLRRGPLDTADSKVQAGSVLLAVDGVDFARNFVVPVPQRGDTSVITGRTFPETAQAVARNLDGDVLDESRSVLSKQSLDHCRQQIRDLERRLLARAR